MTADALWTLEEQLWTGGAEAWDDVLHPASVMAFPAPVGVLSGDQVSESLEGAPRWRSVEMSNRATASEPTVTVLGYKAVGEKPGEPPYAAYCTSTYVLSGEAWKLLQHQQTPVSPA